MSEIPVETDVVVIGSGAAGMAAAVTAAEGGAKVVVFEKQRSLGGTTNFLHGTFAAESDMQRERFIDFTRDEAFRHIMDYSHWLANPWLVRAVVDESGATIRWLQERGVVFTDATINMLGCPRTYHVVKGRGEAIVKALVTQAKSRGADVLPGVPVTGLLKEGGRVSGVLADDDGREVEVTCKAVMVATGGFANNKEWIKKYCGLELGVDVIPIGNTGKVGDGIRMAWEAGAAEEGVEVLEVFRVAPLGPEFSSFSELEMAAMQPDLWVTPFGKRFCDETIGYWDSHVGNANVKWGKSGYTWSVFDDSIIQKMVDNGITRNISVEFLPGHKPQNVHKEIQSAIDNGSTEVVAADSVEGLAEKMGVDPAVLQITVDEYNAACADHRDPVFAKERKYLRALVGPRYYGVKGHTVFLGTMGGIRINEQTEVLDKKNAVIPGLYAGGFDAGGMYGDSYPIKGSSGLASAFALASGRIAGRNILKYLGT
jgi:fumarate reductase flavoprotein subunit